MSSYVQKIYMPYISTYIPKDRITVEQIAKEIRKKGYDFPDVDVKKFKSRYKLIKAPIEHNYTLEEMINMVAIPLLRKLKIKKMPIDQVIFTHTSQVNLYETNIFKRILHQFDFKNTTFYSISQQNCASIHMVINIANKMLTHNKDINGVVIITADKAFHPILRRIPDSILGDSAGACYLTTNGTEPRNRLFKIYNSVDGATYDGVNATEDAINWFNTTYYFAIRQCIKATLEINKKSIDDIALVIGSNVNHETWLKVACLLRTSINKFYLQNISRTGHLYCNDLFVNVKSAVNEKRLQKGDYYLTVTIGLGGTFGCALHQY